MTPAERILARALAESRRDDAGSGRPAMDSAQWTHIHAALRDRAFFSARCDDARQLLAMRDACAKVASGELDESQARLAIRQALDKTGYAPDAGKEGGIQDLRSQRRLDLIIQTNVAEARGYVRYLEGTSAGALAAFPCQELVRVRQPKGGEKAMRDWNKRWREAGGKFYGSERKIALKTDPIWSAISAFGHPWPPFDFNSGMGLRDVGRREAIRYGVIAADDPPPKIDREKRPGFNDNLSEHVPFSAVEKADGDVGTKDWSWLKNQFGDQIQRRGDVVEWRGNLIRQNFAKGGTFEMNLGTASGGLMGLVRANPETKPLADALEKQLQFQVTNGWLDNPRKGGVDHRDHFFMPLPEHPDSKPLVLEDMELIPSVWRQPDRVYNAGEGALCLEIDSLEGDHYREIVSVWAVDRAGKVPPRLRIQPKLLTFFRTSEPFEEKQWTP